MNRRASFTFIFINLVIDAMGIGLIMPVMPDLIQSVRGGDIGNAALWGGVLATAFAVMQFIFGPTLGNLSDRYGRKPILIISLTVMAIDYAVMGLAHSIWMLLILRLIGGITAATQSTATAFISDMSKPEEKSANFGLVGAAFGIGFVLGPIVGGLLGDLNPRAPFYAAAILSGLNVIFGLLVLPESLPIEKRRPFDWRRANPIGALSQIKRNPRLSRFLLMFFLYDFAFFVYPAIWAYFSAVQFNWDTTTVGLSLGLFGISIAVVQGVLIRRILPLLGEKRTLMFGFSFNILVFVILAFIQSGTLALILTPLTAFGAVVIPTLQGIMSRMASDNEQGELQGIITSVRSLSVILSPLVMTATFFLATRPDLDFKLPGAPFLVAAGLVGVCFLLFLGRRKGSLSQQQTKGA